MERVDRLERLTNLVLVLLDTRRPLTLREITDTVAGYPDSAERCRQAFERDKRTLREEGVVLSMEPVRREAEGSQLGYRIRPEDYYLPDLGLVPDEQVALNLAVAAVHLDDPSARQALMKLGMLDRAGPTAVAALPSLPALPLLHEALRAHAQVGFEYRGRQRMVDPWGLVFRHGRWYLVGRDQDHDQVRTYRVDRMAGSPSVGPGTFSPPADLDPSSLLTAEPWELGEGQMSVAHVLVDPLLAAEVIAELGADAVLRRHDDGSVVVQLEVVNPDAFRSWVLGLLDHAEVIGPPHLRAGVTSWLEQLAGGVPARQEQAGARAPR